MDIARLCGYVRRKRQGKKTALVLETQDQSYSLLHRVDSGILDSVVDKKITAEGVLRGGEFTIYTHAKHCA